MQKQPADEGSLAGYAEGQRPTGLTRRPWSAALVQQLGLVVVTAALFAGLTIKGYADAQPGSPNTFLNAQNLVGGVASPMSYYAIMAVGVTVVILTGGIDISIGSVLAISSLAAAYALEHLPHDAPWWKAIPIGVGVPVFVGLVCGLLNGLLVVGLKMHPFIVTLGTLSIFRGLATVLPPQPTLPINGQPLPEVFRAVMQAGVTLKVTIRPGVQIDVPLELMPLFIMLGCVVLGYVFMQHTIWGRETYAVGGNEEAARFSGINVGTVKLRAYAISGLAAGIGGLVSLGRFGTASTNTGSSYELTVIAAAVVGGASLAGGRGGAIGAAVGTLLIALIENAIIIMRWQQENRLIIVGGAIIVAVAAERLAHVAGRFGRLWGR
jgi:ribose/xylose/arabinose/galactoside ABC-type transport system permease subunit